MLRNDTRLSGEHARLGRGFRRLAESQFALPSSRKRGAFADARDGLGAAHRLTSVPAGAKSARSTDNSVTHISSHAPLPVSVRLRELRHLSMPGPVASTNSPFKCTSEPVRKDLQRVAISD